MYLVRSFETIWNALSRRDYQALSAGRHFMHHIPRRNGKAEPQRAKLIHESQWLRELVANLSAENLALKKVVGRVIMEP